MIKSTQKMEDLKLVLDLIFDTRGSSVFEFESNVLKATADHSISYLEHT